VGALRSRRALSVTTTSEPATSARLRDLLRRVLAAPLRRTFWGRTRLAAHRRSHRGGVLVLLVVRLGFGVAVVRLPMACSAPAAAPA
jgi:hypothetical protein